MTENFVHLHNHLEYSLLDGAAGAKTLVNEAARLGMPALAMTDHGNLLGAFDFYKACKAAGINPIIGLETYLAPGQTSRTTREKVRWNRGGEDDISGGGAYTHMTLLSTDTASMHNLFRLNSQSWLDGFYSKPRADRDLLHKYGKGLIGTTGCPSGEIQTLLRMGRYDQARETAAEFRDIFGPGYFFVELMDHGLDIERRAMEGLLQLSKDLDLPLLATNDLHYTYAHEAEIHDALLCINSGSNLADEQRFRFDAKDFYLKTAEEMRHLWRNYPQACDNTLLVAEMADVSFTLGQNLMPRFPVAEGQTEPELFEAQVWAGMATRFPDGISDKAREQAAYEIGVINSMGFPGYFLVVADFINWAKEQGIRVGPGRGSGAGSMCAYAMRITDLDPIRHGLIFERFLNPDRVSMPDFDIDFDELRRGEVINYVTEKYGSERVAQIVTMGRIQAKQALKDSSRIQGYPYAMGDRLTKAYPPAIMGKNMPLADVFDKSSKRYSEAAEFRTLVEGDPDARKVVDIARGVEGFIRATGVHAAGVIMSAEPLMDVIPIMKREADGAIITQFEYPVCEDLGMVKMDFLGLSNLTTIDGALVNIKANRGVDLDLTVLDATLNDKATFDLLARGDTLGVFQLDGGPMRALLRSMRPDNFEDISAVLALYRPGPMGVNAHNDYADRKNGRKPVTPIHPELADALQEILGDTYGLIVYQEQVMAIAQQLAGYTLGGADLLRRAMGKKKKEELDKQYATFESGMQANGYSAAAIFALWETLLPFADYAFNKAHSAAYGVVSYYTAYLKANYPVEYMAALLTTNQDDKAKTAIYLNECRRMGIEVLSPDVNESVANYAAVGDNIRVGLAAIRNVGDGVVASIIRGRSAGPYVSFPDFLAKIDVAGCQKRAIESLIKGGSFDSLGHKRRALDLIHAPAVESQVSLKKQEAIGQDSLFAGLALDDDTSGSVNVIVNDTITEWDKRTLLSFEKDMLGLYVSDHPLSGLGDLLRAKTEHSVGGLLEQGLRNVGQMVVLGGMVSGYTRKTTKKGDLFATFNLEDLDGEIPAVAFPNAYQASIDFLTDDAFVLVRGKVESNDDETLKFLVDTIKVLDTTQAAVPDPVTIHVAETRLSADVLDQFRDTLKANPGPLPVRLSVSERDRTRLWELAPEFRVTLTSSFVADAKTLFGIDCMSARAPRPGIPADQADQSTPAVTEAPVAEAGPPAAA